MKASSHKAPSTLGDNRKQEGALYFRRLVKVAILVAILVAVGAYYLIAYKRNNCDRAARADLAKLQIVWGRLQQELIDHGCDPSKWKLREKYIRFMVGPYYGWMGTTTRCEVRLRVRDEEVWSCSARGSRPWGIGKKRTIFRIRFSDGQWLPNKMEPCHGSAYGSDRGDACFVSSIVNPEDCSFVGKVSGTSPAERQKLEECRELGEPTVERSDQLAALADRAINPFGLAMYKAVVPTKGNQENFFLSPFGMYMPLAMVYHGARGDTRSEMTKVMGVEEAGVPLHDTLPALSEVMQCAVMNAGGKLHIENAAFADQALPILPAYEDFLRSHYGIGIERLDFRNQAEAVARITGTSPGSDRESDDGYLKPRFLSEAGPVALVLTDVIRFKAKWDVELRFEERLTTDAPFFLLDGGQTMVPLMFKEGRFNYMEEDDIQALELPYEGREVSMVVMLPKRRNGLTAIEKRLSQGTIDRWLGKLKPWPSGVKAYIPRFEMSYNVGLLKPLWSMGIRKAQIYGKADFTGISGGLYLGAAFQRGWIEVNEEGTEAYIESRIGIVAADDDDRPEPKVFRADHPFLFLVRHNPSGCILLIGRLTLP